MNSLGKIFAGISLVFLLTNMALSQALLTEDFNYTAATTLVGQGGWTQTSTIATNPITVGATNLTYTGYSNVAGNSISLTTSGQDIYLGFTNVTSDSLYASFLVNFTSAQVSAGGDYFFHFGGTLGTTSLFYARVYVRVAANSNLTFGMAKSSAVAGSPMWSDSIYSTATTYLMVVKYKFNTATSTDDQASLFVFADPTLPASEPSTPTVGPVATTQTDATGITEMCLRQGSATTAPALVIDGFRVATSWTFAPLPVEMVSFTAAANRLTASLRWSTATEVNNFGFEIERKSATTSWSKVGFVAGAGTSTSLHTYTFLDNVDQAGMYEYRIKQIDKNGAFKYSPSTQIEVGLAAKALSLGANYPNPFNPSTNLEFTVPSDGRVVLKVYNIVGQEVATLFDGNAVAGQINKASFNASRLPSGVYFSRMEFGGNLLVKRMMLLK